MFFPICLDKSEITFLGNEAADRYFELRKFYNQFSISQYIGCQNILKSLMVNMIHCFEILKLLMVNMIGCFEILKLLIVKMIDHFENLDLVMTNMIDCFEIFKLWLVNVDDLCWKFHEICWHLMNFSD